MFRKLSAIEIAEGALLADIAIVFQLLTLYLPVGGDFFRVLIFIVYAVLVLRRGLYVGVMGMMVSLFIAAILTGPQLVIGLSLEAMGGLFLGFVMKHRVSHFLSLFVGITCGALASYIVLFLGSLVFGIPLSSLVRGLRNSYNTAMGLIGVLFGSIGLGGWWQHTFLPFIAPLVAFGFKYWYGLYYVALWAILCPFVIAIYLVTNTVVRRLGYSVRPFPDGRVYRWQRRFSRWMIKRAVRRRRLLRRQRAARA